MRDELFSRRKRMMFLLAARNKLRVVFKAVSEINWGSIDAGGNSTATIWVKNSGTVPLKLSMTYQNFDPPVPKNYITLQWNQQDTVLSVGQSVPATFLLQVSPLVLDVTTFNVQLSINGVQN